MKIVVNTRFLLKDKLEGIGVFSKNFLINLVKSHPEHEYIFLFDRNFDESFIFSENVKGVVLYPSARHPFLWYLWFEHAVASFLQNNKPDLFISLDGQLSLKANCKTLLVIHDLAFENYPKDIPWLASKYYKWFTPKFANKASHIITVSDFSKQDIIKRYKINDSKITVAYNGLSDGFRPLSVDEMKEVKESLTLGKEYFIYLGSVHPRKNIPNLLRAFDKFKIKSGSDFKLVIVGKNFFKNQELLSVYNSMQFKSDVVFKGRVDDEQAQKYLGSAFALIYISYFEGFGIPILEAFSSQVPVITSNVSSMPEVAGDAALLVNPFDLDEVADAMIQLIENQDLKQILIENGTMQKNKFSWIVSTEKIWKEIEKLTSKKPKN